MTYDRTRTARPANVTDTPVASDAMMPAVFTAPGTVCKGRSADWAVTELYSLHYRALVRLAVLLVRDIPTAEDVVQDSFVAMHESWERLRNADSALPYLRHAVLNRCRSVLRHRAVVDKHLPNPPPGMPSAEYGALVRLEQSAVVAALRRLSGRQREAIVLRYYADFSEAEVAAAMGISCGAVKSHTARAMAALRADLEQRTEPGSPDSQLRRRPAAARGTDR
jgi:RNA polymerase sigma-70 factor (sigma-E family)